MASEGQERAQAASLTSLPRVEDLPSAADGYDREKVREAFESFRRHTTQLQVQLRVLQAAGQGSAEPTGHAVRMDALHMIRAAAEMADTIERDGQTASAAQLRRTEEEVARRQRDLQDRSAEVDRYRQESERQRAEMLNAAKTESRQTLQEAQQQAAKEVSEAESRAARLLEQSRHQATELTNATRAEIEQTLEWARGQAGAIIHRAQEGAEQLLAAAGLGDAVDLVLAETRRREQLLGALLCSRHDRGGLRTRPLQRLLDLGARRIRELGRLVPRLLEESCRTRLGLAHLLRGVALRRLEEFTRLVAGGVQDLGPLPLRLLAVALDLRLPLLELELPAAPLFFGARELAGGGLLRVSLDRVGELGRGADHVQRVHPNGMTGRLHRRRAAGGLKHAELRLELRGVPAEGVERLAHTVGVVAAAGRLRQIFETGQCRQRRRGRLAGFLRCGHGALGSPSAAADDGPASMTTPSA